MKAKINSFLIGIILLIGQSCDTTLIDEDPLGATEATFFSSVDEFRSQLIGVYAAYFDWYHYSAPSFNPGGYVTGTFLLPGDDLTTRDDIRNEVELFDGSLNPTQSRVTWIYESSYKVITRANVTIEKVRTIDFSDFEGSTEITGMEGEALFLRAFAYYTLFNLFGDVPVVTERVLEREATNTPKSTALEVLEQVISDAQTAVSILPDSWDAVNRGRITKSSALGLLAKALVFRANYNGEDSADFQAAISAFNDINASLTANFTDNFSAFTENNQESLYEIQATQAAALNNLILHNDGPWRGVENASVYHGYRMEPGGPGFNDASTKFYITEKLLTAYGTDPRINAFLNPDDGNNGLIFQKYNKPDGVNSFTPPHGGSTNNERLLRYADIKLCIAEAELKTGNLAAAIGHVNDIRTRARAWATADGLGDGTIPGDYNTGESNTDVIMQWIMDERWVELAGEGQRWYDLKRWHASGDLDLTGWGGGIEHFSTNLASPVQFDVSKHLLFPLPQSEIDRNSAINENNPGY